VKSKPKSPRPRKSLPEEDWIAATDVVWAYRDRTRRASRLAISRPEQRPTGEWGCRVAGMPMDGATRTIFGVSSWQALQLAMQLIGYDVHHHVERGGKILWPPAKGK
jgi:hypothetical protein